jgi:hypothetical protein
MKNLGSWVIVVGSLTMVAAGCGAAADGADVSDDATGTTRAPIEISARGPLALVGEAFADVPLAADQRTEIESLAKQAEARHTKVADAKRALALAAADQIERGKIDRAALQPSIDALVAAMEASRPDDRKAIARVHAILDEDQREDLVDAVEDRIKEKFHGGSPRKKMVEIAETLKLTDDQKDEIKSAFKAKLQGDAGKAGFRERMQRGRDALDDFRGDDFSIDEAMPAKDLQALSGTMTERVIEAAETVLPILTAEQRKIAAQLLRERAEDLMP